MPDVRQARTQEEKEAVYRFRYRLYVQELKRDLPGTDHAHERICEPHDAYSRHLYIADENEDLCAVVSETGLEAGPVPEYWRDYLGIDKLLREIPAPRVAVTSRLMLRSDFRRSAALGGLLNLMFEEALDAGREYGLIYCASGLTGMYEQLGYRRHTDNFNTSDQGVYRIPMLLVLHDLEHLEQVRSPFYRIARLRTLQPPPLNRLHELFPKLRTALNTRMMTEQDLFAHIEEGLHRQHYSRDPLIFRDLAPEEVQTVIQRSVVLDVKKGDRIITRGNYAREIFLALHGLFEVTIDAGAERLSLGVLGPGEVFGELSFLLQEQRTADVYALADGQALVFNDDLFLKLNKRRPDIALKLSFNLLRILAQRLADTNRGILQIASRATPTSPAEAGEPA